MSNFWENLGSGGPELNAQAGSTSGVDTNDPTYLAHIDGLNYLYLPGVSGNHAVVPYSLSASITGDIDIQCRVSLDDWTPASSMALLSQNSGADPNRSWYFAVGSTGILQFAYYPTGSAASAIFIDSSIPLPSIDGVPMWVRVTLDVDNGSGSKEVRFFYASDQSTVPLTWTQLGTTSTTAGTTSLPSVVAGINVGRASDNGTFPLAGKFYRAILRNGINANPVLDVDFTTGITTGAATEIFQTGQTIPTSNAALSNLGTGGLELNAQYGSSTGLDTNDPAFLAHTGTNYLYLPGVTSNYSFVPHSESLNLLGTEETKFLSLPGTNGNYASTPYASAFNITGNIDVRVRVALEDWTPTAIQSFICRRQGANEVWQLRVQGGSTGRIELVWWESGGTVRIASVGVGSGIADGTAAWIRATLNVNSGGQYLVQIYKATDSAVEPSSWTQIGSNIVGTTGPSNIVSNTVAPVFVGSGNSGSSEMLAGSIYRAQVRDGIGGSTVFDADFSQQPIGSREFTESTGKAVTINGAAAQIVDGTTYLYLPGSSGNISSTPTTAALDITGDVEIVCRVALADLTSIGTIISKGTGYLVYFDPAGTRLVGYANSTFYNSTAVPYAAGQPFWFKFTRVAATGAANFYFAADQASEPTSWTSSGSATSGAGNLSTNSDNLSIGANTISGSFKSQIVYRAIVRNGIGGTKVFDADFTRQIQFASSFTEATGKVVTNNGFARVERARDLEVVLRAALDSFSASGTLLGSEVGDPNRRFRLTTTSTRQLSFQWYPTGSVASIKYQGSNVHGLSNGVTYWLKFTLAAGTGQGRFYYASDQEAEPTVWTEIGTSVEPAGATSLANVTAALEIGSFSNGGGTSTPGKFYRVIVRDGIGVDKPTILDADFTTGIVDGAQTSLSISGTAAGIANAQVLTNAGSGGPLLNAQVGSSVTANTNDPDILAHTGENYLYLPGVTGNFVSVPDAPALDVNSFEIIARVALDDWGNATVNQAVVSKYTNTTLGGVAQRSYMLRINARYLLLDYILESSNTTVLQANTQAGFLDAVTLPNGSFGWIRVTRDSATGTVQFFKAIDTGSPTILPASWTQATTSGTQTAGALYNTTATTNIGSFAETGVGYPLAGKVSRVIIRNAASSGTAVLDLDFSKVLTTGSEIVLPSSSTGSPTIPEPGQTLPNLGTGGALLNATLGSSLLAEPTTNDPVGLAHSGENYLYLPGTNGNYVSVPHADSLNILGVEGTKFLSLAGVNGNSASTPDVAALNLTGDFEIVARVALDDWTPAAIGTLVAQFDETGNQRSFMWRVRTDGTLELLCSPDGINSSLSYISTVAVPFSDTAAGWIKVTFDADNGSGNRVVRFWTAADQSSEPSSWTPLGDPRDSVGVGGLHPSTANLVVGAFRNTSVQVASGKFFRAILRNGIGGTAVFDADFTQQRIGSSGFIESTGKAIVINGATTQIVDGTTYLYLPGVNGSYASTPDAAALDITGDIDIQCRVALSEFSTAQALVSKAQTSAGGYELAVSGGFMRFIWADGTTTFTRFSVNTLTAAGLTAGATYWLRATLDVDNGAGGAQVNFFWAPDSVTEPTSWTAFTQPAAEGATTVIGNASQQLGVGAYFNGGATPLNGRFFRSIIRNGIGGTKVFDADFTRQIQFASSFTEATGKVVTTQGAARIERARDLEVVMRASIDAWPPGVEQFLAGKYNITGNQRGWSVSLTSTRRLAVRAGTDGATAFYAQSSADAPFASNTNYWLKFTLEAANGANKTANFYYAPDSPTEPFVWTQIGASVQTPGCTSIFPSNVAVEIGTINNGGTGPFSGKNYRTIIRNGIGGTTVLDLDFTAMLTTGAEVAMPSSGPGAPVIPETSQTLPNLGWGGSALDATLGSGIGTDTNDPLYLLHTGTNYLYLPGGTNSANYAFTPSPIGSSTDIAGDLAIAVHVDRDVPLNDGVLILKRQSGVDSSNGPFNFSVFTLGGKRVLRFLWVQSDGTARDVFGSVDVDPAQYPHIGVTHDVDNGSGGNDVSFWTSTDGNSWSLVEKITNAYTTNHRSNAAQIGIGGTDVGAWGVIGKYYRARIWNLASFAGAPVLDVDFRTGITSGSEASFSAYRIPAFIIRNTGGTNTNWITVPGATRPADASVDARVQCVRPLGTAPQGHRPFQNGLYPSFSQDNSYVFSFAATDASFPTISISKATIDAIAPIGGVIQLRNTWDQSTDTLTVFARSGNALPLSSDTGWTQVGSVIHAGKQADTVARPLHIGFGDNGSSFTADVHEVIISLNGTTVYRVQATDYPTSGTPSTFTVTSGQTATITGSVPVEGPSATINIHRSSTSRKSVAVTKTTMLFGADDSMFVADNALLDFNATDSMTVVVVGRQWHAMNYRGIIGKRVNPTSTNAGWSLIQPNTFSFRMESRGGGVTDDWATSTVTAPGNVFVVSAVKTGTGTNSTYVNLSATSSTDTNIDWSNSEPLVIGKTDSSASAWADFEFFGAVIWRRALTAEEIALINTHYQSGPTAASRALLSEAVLWLDPATRQVATINRTSSGRKSVAVVRPTILFGTDDFMSVADNDLLDFAATDSFSLVVAARLWTTPLSGGRLLSKGTGGVASSVILTATTGFQAGMRLDGAGGTAVNPQSPASSTGKFAVFTGVRNATADTVTTYLNDSAGTPLTDTTTGTLANSTALNIGRDGSGSAYQDFEFFAAAAFRRALSASEVALVNAHYQTGPTTASRALLSEAVLWLDPSVTKVATISRSSTGRKSVAVVRPTLLFGTDDFLEVADNNDLLDFKAGDPFTVVAAVRQWGTGGGYMAYASKVNPDSNSNVGWGQVRLTGAATSALDLKDGSGTATGTNFAQAYTSGAMSVLTSQRNGSTASHQVNKNTPTTGTASTLSLANSLPLRIGANPGGTPFYADFEFFGAAIWRRALTALEVQTVSDHYTGTVTTASIALLSEAVLWIDPARSNSAAVISRPSSGRKSVAVVRPTILFGTDDSMSVPDSDLLDFGASDSFTVVSATRIWNTMGAGVNIVNKRSGVDLDGWVQRLGGGVFTPQTVVDDGADSVITQGGNITAGALVVITGVIDRAAVTGTTYSDTTAGIAQSISTIGSIANSHQLRIGGTPDGSTFADMEFFGAALFRRALSASEIALVNTHYQTGPTSDSYNLLRGATWWVDAAMPTTLQIARSSSGKKSVAVTQDVWLLGSDDFFQVADSNLIDFSSSESLTVIALIRQWNTSASGRYVNKGSVSGSARYAISGVPNLQAVGVISDGVNPAVVPYGPILSNGNLSSLAFVVDRNTNLATTYTNSVPGTPLSIASVGSAENSSTLRIGAQSDGTLFQDFECYAVLVYRRALSQTEISSITNYYVERIP